MSCTEADATQRYSAWGRDTPRSDLVLFLPQEKILFAGDLVFNQMHPWLADGDPDAWQKALTCLKTLHPNTVVPGHGLPGEVGIVDSMATYISVLKEQARAMLKNGTVGIDNAKVPTRFRTWGLQRFYAPNLQCMINWASN